MTIHNPALHLKIALAGLFAGLSFIAVAAELLDIDYAIVNAALSHGLGNDTTDVVIDTTTTGANLGVGFETQGLAELAEELGTSPRALAEWQRLNRDRSKLDSDLTVPATLHRFSESDRDKIFNSADPSANWTAFKRAYPKASGILRVSRPGIDDPNDKALIYVEFQCGEVCGSGRLVNLERDPNDVWHVTAGTLLWITSPPEDPAPQ